MHLSPGTTSASLNRVYAKNVTYGDGLLLLWALQCKSHGAIVQAAGVHVADPR